MDAKCLSRVMVRLACFMLLAATPVLAVDVSDSFDRVNSNAIGVTEQIAAGRWVESGDNTTGDLIRVDGNTVSMHYFLSTPNSPSLSCNVGGFVAADIDFSVRVQPYSNYYGQYYGVGYRMPSQMGRYQNAGGYYVRLNRNVTPNRVFLYYGDSEIAAADVTLPANDFATLRVVASGTLHQIYVEGTLAIDTTHAGNTDSGYVGFYTYYSIACFDDVRLTRADSDEVIRDNFNRANSNMVAGMTAGERAWTEAGENVNGDLIKILNNVVTMHYFASQPQSNSLALILTNYTAADVDIRASLQPYSDYYGGYYGIGYRLPSATSRYCDTGGYYVQLSRKVSPNTVTLFYGTTQVAQANVVIPSGFSELRVVAVGDSHKVYLDPGTLADNFNRADSTTVGSMSAGPYFWNETGDNSNDDLIRISGNTLCLDYSASSPENYNLACHVAGLTAADVDFSVDLAPASAAEGRSYGVGYRLASADDTFGAAGGYYVQLVKSTTLHTLTLWHGTTQVASAQVTIPDGFATLRVVASGVKHQVYFQGVKTLDVTDYRKTVPGYLGVFAGQSIVQADNFSMLQVSNGPVLSATHCGNTGSGHAGIFAYYSIIDCNSFRVGAVPSLRPEGGRFLLGLYSIDDTGLMEQERRFGWALAHTCATDMTGFFNNCHAGGMRGMMSLPSGPEDEYGNCTALTEEEIAAVASGVAHDDYLLWWNLPEEMRWWRQPEMSIVTNYTAWTRSYDPKGRPNYMYIPGHYSQADVEKYVPYLDIVPAAIYTTYAGQPRPWVRWRMTTTVQAITQLKKAEPDVYYDIGDNWKQGQKTPVGVLELFHYPDREVNTYEGAYHDFWQALVCGARGIMVNSYAYRSDPADLYHCWDAYCKAASELTGPENLGTVLLDGTVDANVAFTVTSGPAETDPFAPYGADQMTYPSLNLRAVTYNGSTYVIVVNSTSSTVGATIWNLPAGTAKVLFEGRTRTITNGSMTDTWAPLAVHIYKIDG